MTNKFEYSIVQAMPDEIRNEKVNIGLVIYLDSRLDIHMLTNFQKAQALNPNLDLSLYIDLPATLNYLFEMFEPSNHLEAVNLLQGHSGFSLGGHGEFFCDSDDEYQKHVASLMRRMIITPSKKVVQKQKSTKLVTEMRDYFKAANVLGSEEGDIENHLVVPNFAIDPGMDLYADFALKNGSYHLTEAITFPAKGSRTELNKTAALASIKGVRARSVLSKNSKQIIVYSATAREESDAEISAQILMLEEFSDQCFNFLSNIERAKYYESMLEKAQNIDKDGQHLIN